VLMAIDRLQPHIRESAHVTPILTARIAPEAQPGPFSQIETVLKTDSMVLLTGTAHPRLAQSVGQELSKILNEPIVVYEATSRFQDGEININIEPNLRNRHVFIIQGAPGLNNKMSVNDAVAEVEYTLDAAVRASASELTVVTPYSFYARQDRKDRPRAPISAAAVATKFQALGANRIVTMDLHAEQEQGFAQIPWDNLYASHVLIPEIQKLGLENLIVASPDAGGVKRAKKYKDALDAEGLALVIKDRDVSNGQVTSLGDGQIIGDVKDKPVLIVDDIIGSGTTVRNAAELLLANGATEVYLAAAHGVFSGNALQNLEVFKHVFFTDSVNHEGVEFPENMSEITIAPLLAEAIKRINSGESVSKGFILPHDGSRQLTN